jgi:hypothetical protein
MVCHCKGIGNAAANILKEARAQRRVRAGFALWKAQAALVVQPMNASFATAGHDDLGWHLLPLNLWVNVLIPAISSHIRDRVPRDAKATCKRCNAISAGQDLVDLLFIEPTPSDRAVNKLSGLKASSNSAVL